MAAKNIKRYVGVAALGLILNSAGAYALAVHLGYLPAPDIDGAVNFVDAKFQEMLGSETKSAALEQAPDADAGVDAEKEAVTDIARQIGGDEPEPIHIPTARPRPRELKTFAFEVTGEEREEVVAGYVLGEDGVSDDMRRAWEVLERANRDNGDPGRAEDPEVFNRAAGEIGYVPSGVRPETIRAVNSEIGSAGHEVIRGTFEPRTADSGEVDGVLIRLQGIRAPREGDTCLNMAGSAYDCAEWALNGLTTILSGRDLSCEVMDLVDEASEARIGWCSVQMRNGATRDIGDIAVQAGIASIEDTGGMLSPYVRAQIEAREAKNGIWSGSFVPEPIKED